MDNDDVVYLINELNKYAVVHLTYSKNNSAGFPMAQLFNLYNLERYCKEVLKYY
ncbi:hypothetical protein KEH51_01410 [[Brevibacterium] frigoritolerans]|uniref:Uncharacterized protein n=1 Tax=Peribacillus frigoritolerans TaxID=450367 RepID=A0A941FFM1_9BACI|nr:hypothetical protein [Peribacillus frigoritolerans]